MRFLGLVAKLLLFVLLLGFAAKNGEPVVLRYFLGLEWHTPLALALFVFFAVGLLLGLLLGSARYWRLGRERLRLRRAQRNHSEKTP